MPLPTKQSINYVAFKFVIPSLFREYIPGIPFGVIAPRHERHALAESMINLNKQPSDDTRCIRIDLPLLRGECHSQENIYFT